MAAQTVNEIVNVPIGTFSNPLPTVQNEGQARELAKKISHKFGRSRLCDMFL
jgi:hypothetical protein